MNEKMIEFESRLSGIISQETINRLAELVPDKVNPSSVVPIIAGIVKRLPAGMSADEIVAAVQKQMEEKSRSSKAQHADKPGSARALMRKYFDSMLLEMRLMGAEEPVLETEIFGHKFASPIMTGALSHMSPFIKGEYGLAEFLAQGAMAAGCLHWVGMTECDHYEQIAGTGAKIVRVIKPYADEKKIFKQIEQSERLGAVAIAMDIDHVLTTYGENDIAMGEDLCRKTLDQMKEYVNATKLPFIVKGVLSAHDALRCAEIGAKGIMVSNHGGRLPFVLPPLMVLPDIKKAVGSDLKIFVDGEIRSGIDAYKAMALGADAVGVGVHLVSFAKKDGAKAVEQRLREMTKELKGAMAFTDVKDCSDFDPSVIHFRNF